MVGSRVFLGGLNYRVSEWDIEKFFKGYQGVGDITLKNGYAFVEFEDKREAEDAIYEMNGRDLLGGRVTVEKANERPRDNNRFRGGGAGGGGGGRRGMGGGGYGGRGSRSGGANEIKYRLRVTNLSRSVGWRDLKDYMRSAGEVTYADAHRQRQNEGIIDFATVSDMRNAIKKLDGKELRGRNIRLVDEYGHLRRYRSMSRSRSRSPRRRSRSMSRSRSRSGTPMRNKRSMSRESRSRSRDRNRRPASRSMTPSPRRGSRSDDD